MSPIFSIPIAIALGGAFLSVVHPGFGFAGTAIAMSWMAGLWLAKRVEEYRAIRRARTPVAHDAEEEAGFARLLKREAEEGPTMETAPF